MDNRDRHRSRRSLRLLIALLALASAAIGVLSATTTAITPRAVRKVPSRAGNPPQRPDHPNIVFVLTDDLAWNLVAYMPHVLELERRGLTFEDYFVSDSLCCPSRSSIFTGNLPHNTKVFSNVGKYGGFRTFYERHEERHTFAVALSRAGYRTAMMGKYLNGYLDGQGAPPPVPATYVPPGWSDWQVAGNGYPEFDYVMNENGQLHRYGHKPQDYLTDVLAQRGVGFIDRAARQSEPFFLELATFAPHSPYVPAPRDAVDFPGLKAPRPPNFNELPTHPPGWLAAHPPLRKEQVHQIDDVFRRRAQSVQAVDAMIGSIEQALSANGLERNTYLVFSSDNGLHEGQYRLMPGKLTAFDPDIRVPLVVVGPGVPGGMVTHKLAENIDLASTFTALAGLPWRSDGRSLLALLQGKPTPLWRTAALVEHHGADLSGIDPDFQQPASGNPRTYEAMRTATFLYVEYPDGEREYYDLVHDPFERHNIASTLAAGTRALLHDQLSRLERCHGSRSCWSAMHTGPAG